MKKDSMNAGSLHALRRDVRVARRRHIVDLEAQLTELKQLERDTDIARYRAGELQELDKRIAAMRVERPTVYVEDIIIDRLYEAEANLSLAIGLYAELAADEHSPYLSYKETLEGALETMRDALHLRNPESRV